MELSSKTEEQLRIVSVRETRIDAAVAIAFKDGMRAETDGGPGRVILDLSDVEFIDSSGLGAIVATLKHLGAGQQLILAGLTPAVDKVFRLTRMDTVFDIFPTLDSALQSLRT